MLCLHPPSPLAPWWCSAASLTLPLWYSHWSVRHETVWVAHKTFRDLYHSLFQCILHSIMHRLGVHYSWYYNYSHEWPTPLSLICLLWFVYVCCHRGLYSVMWRGVSGWLTCRKCSWPNMKSCCGFAWCDWGKPLRIVGFWTEIWTQDLLNTTQESNPIEHNVRSFIHDVLCCFNHLVNWHFISETWSHGFWSPVLDTRWCMFLIDSAWSLS